MFIMVCDLVVVKMTLFPWSVAGKPQWSDKLNFKTNVIPECFYRGWFQILGLWNQGNNPIEY
jgi:hypothetical protein